MNQYSEMKRNDKQAKYKTFHTNWLTGHFFTVVVWDGRTQIKC